MFLTIFLSTLIVGAIADDWRYMMVPCDYRYQPMTNFKKEEWSGPWFHQLRSPSPFEPSTVCTVSNVKLNHNETLSVNSPAQNAITGYDNFWGGLLIPKGASNASEFIYQLPNNAGSYTLVVLDTDYKNYTVVLILDNLRDRYCPGLMNAYLWIATRQPIIKKEYYELALKAIWKNKLPTHSLYQVQQNNC